MFRRFVTFVAFGAFLASFVCAQEKAAPPPQPGNAQKSPANGKNGKEASTREEHVVYVPFKNLKDVFGKDEASVLLPYAQFLEMWNRLGGPIVLPIKPPVAGTITRADYAGSVEGELVRLQATLTVEVLGDEWARLPIQFGEAAVGEAKSEDDAVLVRGVGDGTYELLAHGRGKHEVSFELVARVQSAADGKSFTVNCPPVGVSNLELEIPEKGLVVHVTPRRTSQIVSTDNGVTKIRAVLGSTDRFAVAWQPESGLAAQMAGLANVTDTIVIDVGDGVVHTHATFDYSVLRGSLDSLVLTLPADQRLLDVQVPGLRDWQAEAAEEGRQRLVVRLHAAARDKVRLEIRTESAIPEKEIRLAQFQVVGAARESGIIAVRSSEDVGLEFVTHEAVTRVDASDAPEPLRKPRSTFYKFFNPNFQLAVRASALESRVVVTSFLTVTFEKARVNLRGDFKYDVARAGIFTVRFRLPSGFNLDEAQCEAMDRHEITADGDGQLLTVYLAKKTLGELRVAVLASRPGAVESGDLDLPLIEPVDVPREQGLVAVIAPESLEVNSDAKRLEGARPATLAELAARGFSPQPPQGSTVALAFAFARRPVQIGLATRERPRRIYATVSTVASVKEDRVTITATINYDIKYAGTDTFRIMVRAAVAEKVDIEGDGIKEKRKPEPTDEEAWMARTVVLHVEAIGSRTLTVKYDEDLTVPQQGAVPFKLQPIRVLDVDRDTGELSVLKDRALAIAAKHEGLEEIDVRELTQPVGSEQPYLSYRYFRHPASLDLEVTKHELEEVVKTVVNRAYVESVVNAEGRSTIRARYKVESSERQRLRVTLPAERVLHVTVAGREVQPEKAPAGAGAAPDEKSYFINVSETKTNEEFPLAIVFEAPAPAQEKLAYTDRLGVRLPKFDTGVKVQQLYVRVWLPKKYLAVGEPAGFTNETRYAAEPTGFRLVNAARENPDGWFTVDAGTFDFPTAGNAYLYSSLTAPRELELRYWHTPSMMLLGSLVALAVGAVLVLFRLEARVLLVLALAVVALLIGLFSPEAVMGWLNAARIGIAAAIALWLVLFVLRMRRLRPISLAAAAAGAGTIVLGAAAGSAAAEPPRLLSPEPPAQQSQPSPSMPDSGPSASNPTQGGSHEGQ